MNMQEKMITNPISRIFKTQSNNMETRCSYWQKRGLFFEDNCLANIMYQIMFKFKENYKDKLKVYILFQQNLNGITS